MNDDRQTVYQICIEGLLDPEWSGWFGGLIVAQSASDPVMTTLTGVLDQSALRGVLTRLWDLNLTLISVLPCRDDGLSLEVGGGDA